MTTPIPAWGPTPISQVGAPAPAPSTSGASTELGADAFLKLLVAQLKYQDPSNPADGTAFLAQTAQFTQVEKLSQLVKDQQSLITSQHMLSASSMIGRTITYPGPDGADVTGVVSSATFVGSSPTLRVGNTDVPLSSVKEVHSPA